MYEPHEVFESPTNPDIKIWRYMDLAKLVSLLDTQCLWFARADTLSDPHEGSYGAYNVAHRSEVYADTIPESQQEAVRAFYRRLVRNVYVSCWHMNERESAATWQAYVPSGQGVAITAFNRLTRSLRCEEPVWVGTVPYVDKGSTWIPEGNLFYSFVHKRMSFEHERELRAVTGIFEGKAMEMDAPAPTPSGLNRSVDVTELVEGIYVAPGQGGWFVDAVKRVVRDLAPSIPVGQSAMDDPPVFQPPPPAESQPGRRPARPCPGPRRRQRGDGCAGAGARRPGRPRRCGGRGLSGPCPASGAPDTQVGVGGPAAAGPPRGRQSGCYDPRGWLGQRCSLPSYEVPDCP